MATASRVSDSVGITSRFASEGTARRVNHSTHPIEETNEAQDLKNTITHQKNSRAGRVVSAEMSLWLCALAITITSAIWTKERGTLPGLAGIERVESTNTATPNTDALSINPVALRSQVLASTPDQPAQNEHAIETPSAPTQDKLVQEDPKALDQTIRWFDGKMIRPTRVIYMTITGYSPDERSCGKFADNKTATMYSVWTNGMNLVAADPKVLPYWSMVSIPGYANGDIVPVLDCGGAIKGNRIDLLYPTHKIARQWGVRQLPVTVWEFVEEE